MRYLSIDEVIELHRLALAQSGGLAGIRDLGALESALAQPFMAFGGQGLYPSLADKAAALGFSIIMNHPFVDGNKRAGHAAMETYLVLNGQEIDAPVDEQERLVLSVAAGTTDRATLTTWLQSHLMSSKG